MKSRVEGGKKGALVGGAATAEAIASSATVLTKGRGRGAVGLQQFFTPPAVSEWIAQAIRVRTVGIPEQVLDPTAGDGALLSGFPEDARDGIEIDADQIRSAGRKRRKYHGVKADLQHLYPLLRRLVAKWPIVVANPPFGLTWEAGGLGKGSSTLLTFQMARGLISDGGVGVLICGRDRFYREVLPVAQGAFYAIVEVADLFGGAVAMPCAIAFWQEGERIDGGASDLRLKVERGADLTPELARQVDAARIARYGERRAYGGTEASERLDAAHREYERRLGARVPGQEHTIELRGGKLSVRPGSFAAVALAQHPEGNAYKWLCGFNAQAPSYFALQSREWAKVAALETEGVITIQAAARAAVKQAIETIGRLAVPLYPVAPAQRLGFLVDVETILCTKSDRARGFKKGERYSIKCETQVLASNAQREKQTVDGPVMVPVVVEKKAMKITIGREVFTEGSEELTYILDHFDVPDPGEVAERFPGEVAAWEATLQQVELEIQAREPGFRFRTFQPRDLARLLFKKGGILAWEQGLGKSLAAGSFVRALNIAGRLPDDCALFVMPQDLALQMSDELRRFFGRDLLLVTHLGSDQAHPRKRRRGEVSALELREMVRARRADLAAQRRSVALAPRPPVWAATWFEAIAVTERLEEKLPIEKVVLTDVLLARATKAEQVWQMEARTGRYVNRTIPGNPEKRGRVKVWSTEFCPRCHADHDGGWNGVVCSAKLLDEKVTRRGDDGKEKTETIDNSARRRIAGTHRKKVCGYVHRSILRKPAYSILGGLFKCVIVDEGTKIKGDDSYTSKAVRAIRAEYRCLLTGTPVKNFVIDLFWLLWWALGDSTPRFPYSYSGGRDRFMADFAVMETRLDAKTGKKEKGAQPKMLPEVSNLLRLWKMLCSSLVRRRMDEVGAVVSLDGDWKCPGCKAVQKVDVLPAGAREWTKPPHLECSACHSVWDWIVPLRYVPVAVPWGLAQRRAYAAWLSKSNFSEHFLKKHPNSPLAENPAVVELLAAAIGQFAKLDYATTDATGDPDLLRPEILPKALTKPWKGPSGTEEPPIRRQVSVWTPGRIKILQLAMTHAAAGEKVFIGSSQVAPGPWICAKLRERGVNAVHICEPGADGKMATMAPKKRAASVAEFRTGSAQVLCAGVNAIAFGHNLDVANIGIIDGLPWDFATFDQWLKRIRRLTSKRPVTVYVIIPEDSLATRKWAGLKDKTAASDLALDGKLSVQDEKPLDRAAVLREMQQRGVRFDGTEVPEGEVERLWANWRVESGLAELLVAPAPTAPAAASAPMAAPHRGEREKPRQLSLFAA